jgi:thiamine phosphate synthase YjbQ (UPF0047 family)
VQTTAHTQMLNITRQVAKIVAESGIAQRHLCGLYSPILLPPWTINENADPDVQTDFYERD